LLRGESSATAGNEPPLLLENLLYGPQQRGVLAWPWLCIRYEAGEGGARWYDLGASPGATATVAAPAIADTLLAAVARRTAAADLIAARLRPAGETREIPAQVRRRLRSLGY